ncbi:TolC family protein [Dethiosulfovibrio sp. F2B]|uniref:TolC family protein n=1 Tax=Dethiosulfovibrio faecalis TaxID=2720018 RepID=UPI001F1AFCC3|nr:TolC family protein [Dethiosulfovibrio faecalis]MCF4151069.1 TolC family protein [Dethiosulfovibrio faecalis]
MRFLSSQPIAIVALVAVLALLWPSGSFGETVLTEDAYLSLVLERNEDLAAMGREIDAGVFSARSEMGTQRPSLKLATEIDRWMNRDRGDRYLDLALSHRIDLSGRYGLQERDLLIGLDILRQSFYGSVNDTLAGASSTYRRAVMAGLNLKMREDILEHREKSLEVTREKFEKELVPLLDLLRARSQRDEGEALFLGAHRDYEQRLIEMRSFVGNAEVNPVVEVPDPTSLDLSIDLNSAMEGRPEIEALRLAIEQAGVRKSLAARGLSPLLDLSIGWRLGEDYRSPFAEDNQGELMLTAVLSVPISDGNQTENAVEAARLTEEKADRELRARQDDIAKEIELVRNRWDRGRELETLRRSQIEGSSKELKIAEMLYREGLASQLDLINAQERDQQTRGDHLSAIQELWLVLSEADRVAGRYVSRFTSEPKKGPSPKE